MASTRERARAAMATLDRCDPNLDDVGLNWSSWIDKCDILTDEGASKERHSVDDSRGSDTMTLSKEDMKIYGYCPALDNFYLVVCSHCGQLVKPQAFEAHCERRHGALTKLCNPSSSSAGQQCPRPGRLTSVPSSSSAGQQCPRPGRLTSVPSSSSAGQQCPRPGRLTSVPSSRERHKAGETQEAGVSAKPASAPQQHRTTKVLTEDCRAPPWGRAPLATGSPLSSSPSAHSSSSESSEKRKPATELSAAPRSPLRGGPRTYSRTHKKVYEKECDLDQQCGVLDARNTLCTRQLVCNIRSVRQQRKAADRSKPLDQPLVEQRTGSSGSVVDKLSPSEDSPTPVPATPYLQTLQDPTSAPQHVKHTLGTNGPILWSREPSGRGPEEDGAMEPLGICTFGSHTLGCSIFTFDRRLHHLRFALSDMVEQHVNAHLWKRIPQVPAGLQSCHSTTTTTPQGSAIRPRASGPPGSGSPSSGPSRTSRRNQQNLPSSKPPSAVGPYPNQLPLGRPSKAPLKGREPVIAVGAQNATRQTQSSSRVEVSAAIRKFPLHEKKDQRRQPLLPPANGHRFSGGKPSVRGSPLPSNGWSGAAFASLPRRPPPPSNPRRGVGGGPGGEQQKPGGSAFRGPPAQKRKMGSSEAAGGHPSLARSSSKPHHSSTQPPSGLFSWRKRTSVAASPGE
ncbi:hypothetical protein NHX12_012243 [Muraenolepis orangiensis]|uniref:SCA7 domain-containing protein n=1 Tax=Muraenolepis orangiensis TaxID=630683 RepID=A0A9Q0I5A9_9TELE|nr:hypothetical protein NHX12_012243 [Muraenolepis orangiensis]